jgi:hypothetical protein
MNNRTTKEEGANIETSNRTSSRPRVSSRRNPTRPTYTSPKTHAYAHSTPYAHESTEQGGSSSRDVSSHGRATTQQRLSSIGQSISRGPDLRCRPSGLTCRAQRDHMQTEDRCRRSSILKVVGPSSGEGGRKGSGRRQQQADSRLRTRTSTATQAQSPARVSEQESRI